MARYYVRSFDGRERRYLYGALLSSQIKTGIDVVKLARTWAELAQNQVEGDKITLLLSGC